MQKSRSNTGDTANAKPVMAQALSLEPLNPLAALVTALDKLPQTEVLLASDRYVPNAKGLGKQLIRPAVTVKAKGA